MTNQTVDIAERRVAPRFRAGFAAELAAGTVLVPVRVHDLSIAGCGVVIMSDDPTLPDKLGSHGFINLPALGTGTSRTILPVVLRNLRSEGHRVLYGLEFCSLLAHQKAKLNAVLDTVSEEE